MNSTQMRGIDRLRHETSRLGRAVKANVGGYAEGRIRRLADITEAKAVRVRSEAMESESQRLAPALQPMFDAAQWTFVSTRHIEEELRTLETGSVVTSVGTGRGAADLLLSLRFPQHEFVGTDITDRFPRNGLPPNLSFEVLDLEHPLKDARTADFVYSVECLEHIEDDQSGVDGTMDLLRPGGTMVIIVPFANEDEQRDAELIRQEWENHEHFRPGYNPRSLRDLIGPRFRDIEFSGCYFTDRGARVRQLAAGLESPSPRDQLHLYELAGCDIQPIIPESRAASLGLKLVARGYRG